MIAYKTANAKEKIKEAWNENPIGVAIVVAGLFTASARLIEAVSGVRSKNAYARQGRRSKK